MIARFTFLYSLIVSTRAALFKDTGRVGALFMGLSLLALGYTVATFMIRNKQDLLRMLTTYLLAVLVMVTVIFIFFLTSTDDDLYRVLRSLFEGVAAFLLCFIGIRGKFADYEAMLSKKTIITGVFIFLASIIFLDYFKELSYLKSNIYILGYIFAAITLLVKNQQNLDRAFIQKHIELSKVPKNIRYFNSGIVIIVFIVILALFNINTLISYMTTFIKNIPKYILTVLFAVLYFISKLFPGNEEGGQQTQEEPQLPFLPGDDSKSIVGLIISIVLGLFFLLIFIYLIPKFPQFLRTIGKKIKKLISIITEYFKKFLRIKKDSTDHETDYIDEVEIIPPKDREKKLSRPSDILKMINHKLGRKLSPIEKVRKMYIIVLHGIKKQGIELKKSNTTNEIYKKTLSLENIRGQMKHLTLIYNKVRYGEKEPSKDELESYQVSVRHILNSFKSKQ